MAPARFALRVIPLAVALLGGCHASDAQRTSHSEAAARARTDQRTTPSPSGARARQVSLAPSHDSVTERADLGRIRGDSLAKVWFVIASDFQCPFCKTFHDVTFPLILRDYVNTGKIRVAYLNFPLNMHRNARPAAEAGMCASAQGRFWEMHDALFGSQPRWAESVNPSPFFDSLATQVGVDLPHWRLCMAQHATIPLIQADYDRSAASGVQSTPSFFIGDEGIAGAQPYGDFHAAIERQLGKIRGAGVKVPGH